MVKNIWIHLLSVKSKPHDFKMKTFFVYQVSQENWSLDKISLPVKKYLDSLIIGKIQTSWLQNVKLFLFIKRHIMMVLLKLDEDWASPSSPSPLSPKALTSRLWESGDWKWCVCRFFMVLTWVRRIVWPHFTGWLGDQASICI